MLTFLLVITGAFAGGLLGAAASPRLRSPRVAGGVLGAMLGGVFGWLAAYVVHKPPTMTIFYARMIPALIVAVAVVAALGAVVWRRLEASPVRGGVIGGVSGLLGASLIMNPLQSCTFEADRTGVDRVLGTVLCVTGGVIVLGTVAGIYSSYQRATGRLASKSDVFGKGEFRRQYILPWLLLVPTLVILVLFLYRPTLETMRLSTRLVRLSRPDRQPFVCLDNYTRLIEPSFEWWALVPLAAAVLTTVTIVRLRRQGRDALTSFVVPGWLGGVHGLLLVVTVVLWAGASFGREYRKIYFNTVILTTGTVVLSLAVGLGIAMLVSQRIAGRSFYRTLLIWPYAVSPPIAGILFDRLLASNGLLAGWWSDITGNDFPNYKTSVTFARVVVILASVWKTLGFTIVFYIAGLQNVPSETLEAASIDGASRWEKIRFVTLPALAPITFFLLISTVTYSFFEIFGTIDNTTQGGPLQATTDSMTALFITGKQGNFGDGAARSMILFVMVLAVTAWQFRSTGKRVEYSR